MWKNFCETTELHPPAQNSQLSASYLACGFFAQQRLIMITSIFFIYFFLLNRLIMAWKRCPCKHTHTHTRRRIESECRTGMMEVRHLLFSEKAAGRDGRTCLETEAGLPGPNIHLGGSDDRSPVISPVQRASSEVADCWHGKAYVRVWAFSTLCTIVNKSNQRHIHTFNLIGLDFNHFLWL